MQPEVTLELAVENIVGESLIWDDRTQQLVWVDINSKKIYRWTPGSADYESWDTAEIVTSIGIANEGGYVVGLEKTVNLWQPGEDFIPLAAVETNKPDNRLNEGVVGPDGALWVGTMQNNVNPDGTAKEITAATGAYHRVTADGKTNQVSQSHFGISNTLVWPQNSRVIVADTLANEIYSFASEPETGVLSDKQVILQNYEVGLPDGSCIDSEGYIWNCRVCGGSALIRMSPEGEIDRVIELPCSWPTSCTFGGENLDRLYVTTARFTMTAEHLQQNPQEGALLSVDVGIKGVPEYRFG